MITRKAILIGAPSVESFLPGVVTDVKSMKNFLMSTTGGAWKENEITTLIDRPSKVVMQHIESAKDSDYVFIMCAGHGQHEVRGSLDETAIFLTENETLSINKINPKNKRHFVLVDVCRNVTQMLDSTETLLKGAMESYSSADKFNYREAFDAAIMKCSEGRIVAYSCDINQSAGEDSSGGLFTQSLISSSDAFLPTNGASHGIINIKQAFERAKEKTYERGAPQSAVLNAGRRLDFYPFAIITK